MLGDYTDGPAQKSGTLSVVKPRIPLPVSLSDVPFTYTEGRAAGLGRHRLRGGDLDRPFQGVLLAANQDSTFIALCRALATKLPDDTFFCGASAARVMGVPLPSRLERSRILHVAVPAPGFPPSGRGIRGHMLQVDERRVRTWAGLRITSPEQTWCDLGPVLSIPELVAAGDYLVHWENPITSADALAAMVLERRRYRGVVRLRAAVERLSDRSESAQESALRLLIEDAGLPGLAVNYKIRTSGGYNYRGDLAFPRKKLIVEYQSVLHETPERIRADMTRVSRLEADEYKVIQVNKDDMRDPIELVSRIRRVHNSRPNFD